jgi:hypothetical protein
MASAGSGNPAVREPRSPAAIFIVAYYKEHGRFPDGGELDRFKLTDEQYDLVWEEAMFGIDTRDFKTPSVFE